MKCLKPELWSSQCPWQQSNLICTDVRSLELPQGICATEELTFTPVHTLFLHTHPSHNPSLLSLKYSNSLSFYYIWILLHYHSIHSTLGYHLVTFYSHALHIFKPYEGAAVFDHFHQSQLISSPLADKANLPYRHCFHHPSYLHHYHLSNN